MNSFRIPNMSKSHIQSTGNPKKRQFKGVRQRKWGKWVSEVRIPNCKGRIWLGSYETAEQAARAFDAAVYCLRGPRAKLNFPNSVPAIPSASSLSPHQIQLAAANYALGGFPDTEYASNPIENAVSPSRSSIVSETTEDKRELHTEEFDPAMWDSLLTDSDCNELFNSINFPLPDVVTSASEEQGSVFMWDV